MTAGAGGYDAEGVYQYGEEDEIGEFSDYMNLGEASVSAAIASDRTRLTTLETNQTVKQAQYQWTGRRSSGNTSDNFAAGSFASVASVTITNAPAGYYLISSSAAHASSATGVGYYRLTAGSANLSQDMQTPVPAAAFITRDNYTWPYQHAGGNLTISLFLEVATGTGTVYTIGTGVMAAYLGPSS